MEIKHVKTAILNEDEIECFLNLLEILRDDPDIQIHVLGEKLSEENHKTLAKLIHGLSLLPS